MSKNTAVLGITLLILVLILLGFSYFQGRTATGPAQTVGPIESVPTPVGSSQNVSSSEPPPVQVTTLRGNVKAINKSSISVSSGTQSKTFSIAENINVQKIVSGSLEHGTAVFASATLSEVVVGKEVFVNTAGDTTNASSILIVK